MNPAEEYILQQPEPYKGMLIYLQSIIERTIPGLDLKYKYKIPFYYLDGRPFCYLNHTSDYVDLGFWNAAHLSLHLEKMETKGRKMMRSLRYRQLDEINEQVLREVLNDAYEVRGKGFWR